MENIFDYNILEKIDETTGSEVYRARRNNGDDTVVIKVLKAAYPSLSEIARFKHEYKLIKKIHFNGVIQTYDLLEYSGRFALVLEDFQGLPLNKAFHSQPVSINTFFEIAVSLSQTLGNLHKANIMHMDIKPKNILINLEEHRVKITDFGISKYVTHENEEIYNPEIIRGTLAYLSPEQTGRMNRNVDYRTDLYSLGVTFYELLTGQLPFISKDPLEVIHAHIAKKPVPPNYINPNVPEVISDIVLKLMSKTAEDRYQNSFGLMADLQKCYSLHNREAEIHPFILGEKDISLRFNIPQKLYGRDEEIERLINGFYNASLGSPCVMLVSGNPGIGKTALINEMQKPIVEKKGFFITGKYEQIQRDMPYSAIIQAFQNLINQLLCENKEMVEKWKQRLIKVLSPNEAIISQMIPDVAHIIGKQPEISDLGSEEFKNRFNLAFKNFIKVFAQKAHPLSLFLDDLQWADLSSMQLLKSIVTDPDMTYLLVIASYRSNEVSNSHPFMLLMDDIKNGSFLFEEIELKPLKSSDVNHFVFDFLRCSEKRSKPLAHLVHKKTGGNPFFINQFLKTLHDLQLLQTDTDAGWHWDIDRIQQLKITDNVVDLLSDKIVNLKESTAELLKNSACIGNTFDFEKLSTIIDQPIETIWEDVKIAINEGYIETHGNTFRFQHDRIREAAYHLIPEEKRKKNHYKIGRYTLEKTHAENLSSQVFFITDHLNHAKSLISSQNEKYELANLNLFAGEKALHSAAYASALTYLAHGLALLGRNAWTEQYNLTLKLYSGVVAATCLDGRFDVMKYYSAVALRKCKRVLDEVAFYEFKILAHISQNNLQKAVSTGLTILKKMDITFPEKPNSFHVLLGMIRVRFALQGKTTKDLLNLPEMTDRKILSVGRILTILISPVFQSNPNLYLLMKFKHLLLSLKYGNTPVSAIAYGSYGMLLCAIFEDFDNGYDFGMLSFDLLEKFKSLEFKPQAIPTFNAFIRHWKDHAKESLAPLLEGFQLGKETGKLELGAYNLFLYGGHAFLAGKELNSLDEELTRHMQIVIQMNQRTALNYIKIDKQVVLNLTGKSDDPTRLKGDVYNEEEMLPVHYKTNDQSALAYFFCHKMFLNYLFGNVKEALANAERMKKFFSGTLSTLNVPRYYLFSSLISLKRYPKATMFGKKRIIGKVIKSKKKLKKYAHYCPGNSEFAFFLLTAEHAGVLGDYDTAITYYDKAIESAGKYGFIQHEALCNELAGEFYFARGHIKTARNYMQDARYKYDQWGALAKVRHLDAAYSDLVSVSRRRSDKSAVSRVGSSSSTPPTISSTRHFDFSTILKASEAVFGEIVLSKLLRRLMGILIENAGAEKGFIILEDNGVLQVEAEGSIGSETVDVLKSIPVDHHDGLSAALVGYAARVKKTIILNNAADEGEFVRDPYVVKNKPKSVLCMPILNQGRLSAVLYLENNLATNAFTSERLRVLNMLSSQLAIAIDNAKLYENLEQKVEERTAQLKLAQAENLKKAHRAGMADIAKETLHNVGNILTSIKTVADTMNRSTRDSALVGLTSANNLLRKNMDDLKSFITADPKALKLMEYYIALEMLFKDEKAFTDIQLHRLRQKVDEIARVIQTMQGYIGSDDTYLENVQLMEEVRFVLETKRDGLVKDDIKIEETYNDVPMIRVQKSKLAHILDNLIVNAREAMENASTQEKTISVEIEHKQDKVFLHISDSGEGISKENIQKIFFHGFTTKPGRAGHSLHNCANNMTEMGGGIRVQSEGEGKGAMFTLEFSA